MPSITYLHTDTPLHDPHLAQPSTGDQLAGAGEDGVALEAYRGNGGGFSIVPVVSGTTTAAVTTSYLFNVSLIAELHGALLARRMWEPVYLDLRHFRVPRVESQDVELLHELMLDPELRDEGIPELIDRAISARNLRAPPHIQAVILPMGFDDGGGGGDEAAYRASGFGGVPASAAAIAGLEKQEHHASGDDGDGDDQECVICGVDYEAGDEIGVMPCAYRHRFHRKCLAEWLALSHLCPLCRHALPTEHDDVPELA